MSLFDITTTFLVLVGTVGWLNVRYARLPTGVAMVLAGSIGAGVLLLLQASPGGREAAAPALTALRGLNFSDTVLGYLLAFLLFAGAMQVDLAELRRRSLSVLSLATLGVVASTVLVGGGVSLAARTLGLELPLAWALVFGALISPTDPIAVLAAVRRGSLSKLLQSVLQGEALFNDGVGIVVFTAALAVAVGGEDLHALQAVGAVALQAIGGLILGLAAGALAVRALRAIDDYSVEVSITLALAMGAYAGADALHLSGPIAVVSAGLIVGNRGVATAMSDTTRRYVQGFWTLIDEILNALLFLLLGFELLVVGFEPRHAGLWGAAILLVLAARLVVVLPWGFYFWRRREERGASTILTWGGLHGALSLALALTLPKEEPRDLILSTTFAVVLFSIVVQGLTFPRLTRRVTAVRAHQA